MKKKLIALFAALTLAVCCIVLGACGGVQKIKYENASSYTATDSFTYQAADVDKVEINWVCGNITVVHSAEATLSVSEAGTDFTEAQKMHYLIEGRTLKIQFWESGHSDKNVNEAGKNLTVQVPNGIDLHIESVSGDVTDSNLNASKVWIESVSGNVSIGVAACNDIKVETVSGNVGVSLGGKGATVSFETASGRYTGASENIGDGAVKLDVETVSGDLTVG